MTGGLSSSCPYGVLSYDVISYDAMALKEPGSDALKEPDSDSDGSSDAGATELDGFVFFALAVFFLGVAPRFDGGGLAAVTTFAGDGLRPPAGLGVCFLASFFATGFFSSGISLAKSAGRTLSQVFRNRPGMKLLLVVRLPHQDGNS